MADDIRSTPCIHCKFDNPTGARICQNCKKSQNEIWARIVSIAGLAGAIALGLGAIGFLLDWLPAYRKAFNASEAEIVSFYMANDGALSIKIANEGLNAITVGEIAVFIPTRKKSERGFSSFPDLTVAPRAIGEASKTGDFGSRASMTMQGSRDGRMQTKLALAHLRVAKCFMLSVTDTAPSFFDMTLAADNASRVSVRHETYLRYFSATRGKWLERKVDTRSALWKSGSEECDKVTILEEDLAD